MAPRRRIKHPAYLVHGRTSTRRSLDPESPDYEEWADFEDGQVVTEWPVHAPVEEWVASGHWEPVKERPRG